MSGDCLVFKLEERDVNRGNIDNVIYILYDTRYKNYIMRGQRLETSSHETCDFSFICRDEDDLADYLQYVICSKNTVDETLLNYHNLPCDSDMITFDLLAEGDYRDVELSGYDGKKVTRRRLLINLRMLKNVFNFYN